MDPIEKTFLGKILDVDIQREEIKILYRAKEIRVLFPNSPMTRDYRPERVNIMIDYDKKILQIIMG